MFTIESLVPNMAWVQRLGTDTSIVTSNNHSGVDQVKPKVRDLVY
jgi:hypothetical protein